MCVCEWEGGRQGGGRGRRHLPTANANLEFCCLFFAGVSSCKICVKKVKEEEQEEKDVKQERGKEGEKERSA